MNYHIAIRMRPVVVNYPFVIEKLELTNKCPMKCIMCIRTYKITRPLPFFDEHSVRVLRMLTENGMEYCGRPESHPYELYLQLNEIEHSRIWVRRP